MGGKTPEFPKFELEDIKFAGETYIVRPTQFGKIRASTADFRTMGNLPTSGPSGWTSLEESDCEST